MSKIVTLDYENGEWKITGDFHSEKTIKKIRFLTADVYHTIYVNGLKIESLGYDGNHVMWKFYCKGKHFFSKECFYTAVEDIYNEMKEKNEVTFKISYNELKDEYLLESLDGDIKYSSRYIYNIVGSTYIEDKIKEKIFPKKETILERIKKSKKFDNRYDYIAVYIDNEKSYRFYPHLGLELDDENIIAYSSLNSEYKEIADYLKQLKINIEAL